MAAGRYAIGRFFVTTQQSEQVDHGTVKPGRSKHGGSKRVKKYVMPLSYPEPTIHEETSPNDAEVCVRVCVRVCGRVFVYVERCLCMCACVW